jgi:hypothetical protein
MCGCQEPVIGFMSPYTRVAGDLVAPQSTEKPVDIPASYVFLIGAMSAGVAGGMGALAGKAFGNSAGEWAKGAAVVSGLALAADQGLRYAQDRPMLPHQTHLWMGAALGTALVYLATEG